MAVLRNLVHSGSLGPNVISQINDRTIKLDIKLTAE